MFSIFRKELSAFFSNAAGYIVIGIFLLLTGLFLWVIPGEYNILDNGYANLDSLFVLSPWLFLFLCPAVSMRLLAEEKQTGTWELLITKPLGGWQLVLGKYLAGWVLVVLALLPAMLYYASVSCLAEPVGNVDSGAFWGSFTGLALLAAVYIAIGAFASSLSKNQVVAFILSLTLCFLLYYGFDLFASFFSGGQAIQTLRQFGIYEHYKSMSRGVLDSRDLAYFFLVVFVFLSLTRWKIKK
jgi:ABC-2 type transport system permease protein